MQHEPAPPPGPQLRDLLLVLWRRKAIVVLVAALALATAWYLTDRQAESYRSEARVLVLPAGESSVLEINLETEQGLVSSTVVASRVVDALQLDLTTEELLESLDVSIEGNTEILSIAYTDEDPVVARDRSQAFAQAYLSFKRQQEQELLAAQTRRVEDLIQQVSESVAELSAEIAITTDPVVEQTLAAQEAAQTARLGVLQQQLDDLRSSAEARAGQIVQPAELPTDPVNAGLVRNGVLAFVFGVILGIGLAFLRERLDDRIRDVDDLEEHLGARTVAAIPRTRRVRRRSRPVTVASPRSAGAEAYRALCAGLLFVAEERGARVIMVVSPGSESRRAGTSANIAVALAEAGKRVVLVSADLRAAPPSGKGSGPGLVDVLGGAAVNDVLRPSSVRNLHLLGTGTAPSNPTQVLHSKHTAQLLKDLGSQTDFVIIDSAPALPLADSLVLGAIVDGVVLVARAFETRRDAVGRARDQLERSGAHLLCGVLEGARAPELTGGRPEGRRTPIENVLGSENGHRRSRRRKSRAPSGFDRGWS